MNAEYKGHDIHVTAFHVSDGWEPYLYVVYTGDGRRSVKNLTINQTFSTREEAEQAGISFAQKWIDDGKPDLD